MTYLLDAAYLFALLLASPWLLWRSLRTGRYREGFGAKLLGFVPERTSVGPCVWLHAVSVGEVNLLGTLLAELAMLGPIGNASSRRPRKPATRWPDAAIQI